MSGILIDNKTLLEGFNQHDLLGVEYEINPEQYIFDVNTVRVIFALLLWDDIFYIERDAWDYEYLMQLMSSEGITNEETVLNIARDAKERSIGEVYSLYGWLEELITNRGMDSFDGTLKKIALNKKMSTLAEYQAAKVTAKYYPSFKHSARARFHRYNPYDAEKVQDVLFYHYLGQYLGVNDMVSEDRLESLKQVNASVGGAIEKDIDVLSKFTRIGFVNLIDKNMLEYYDELNAKIGQKVFELKMPLFIDYLFSNYQISTIEELIQHTVALRKEKELIGFRRAMDNLDNAISQGNIKKVEEYVDIITEISSLLKGKYGMENGVCLTVSPNPIVEWKGNFPSPNVLVKIRKYKMDIVYSILRYGYRGKEVSKRHGFPIFL